MPHEIVGFLEEEGYDFSEISEMLTPMEQYDNYGGSLVESRSRSPELAMDRIGPPSTRYDLGPSMSRGDAVFAVLQQAQSERSQRRPGPQKIVPAAAGAIKRGDNVKAARVDTEGSWKGWKRGKGRGRTLEDSPQNAPSIEDLSDHENRILMGAAPFYTQERSIAGEGDDDGFFRRDDGAGTSLLLGSAQSCVLCGAASPGTAVCGGCRVGGVIVGFGERGAASQIYNAPLYEALPEVELLGDLGALETPMQHYDGGQSMIPMSFSQREADDHITSWQNGPDVFSSIRVTGWDGEPRVLTATTKVEREAQRVVGYAQRAGVPPAHLIGILGPLARQLAAGELIPRLAAASPVLLGVARRINSGGPFIVVVGRR